MGIADGGSVQNVKELPTLLRDVYKTVWEVSQRSIIDQAADRGAFICQSQSMHSRCSSCRLSLTRLVSSTSTYLKPSTLEPARPRWNLLRRTVIMKLTRAALCRKASSNSICGVFSLRTVGIGVA